MVELESVVLDASAVFELLLWSQAGRQVQKFVAGKELHAPELMDAEVLSTLKGHERAGRLSTARAEWALRHLERSPIHRHGHRALIRDAWTLRHGASAYDALYLALARRVGCPIITLDRRWQRAGDFGVPIVTVG